MNREIKFRGKRVNGGEWVYGNIQVPTPPFNKYFIWDKNIQVEVHPESIGEYTGLKGYEGDIVDVCVFLVSPENPDNDQHFRGAISFDNGKFVFTIHKYLNFNGSESEWINIRAKDLPFYEEELDEDGTYTMSYFDFVAMSGNLGEFCDDNVEIIGNIYENPTLLQ